MDALERINKQVTDNPVIVYMKGTPDFPQCGFSSRTVQALNASGVESAYVNIFEDEEVYRALPRYENWPTFPADDPAKRIDALLVRGPIEVLEHGDPGIPAVRLAEASDHRPVLATLALK